MAQALFRLVLAFSLLALCTSYKNYQTNIPNGDAVTHPCKENLVWQGVGHEFMLGGGKRNPFGEDFAGQSHTWTDDLCQDDSDGDGRTNGEELGDPSCTWTKGDTPSRTENITHPGICEPTDSDDCKAKNAWEIDCSEGDDFWCEGVDDQDTVAHTVRLDNTKVPARETTYMCQGFSLPSDKEYHLFAVKPVIDNAYVMHHTIVYGCKTKIEGFDGPVECGMYNEDCEDMLGGWTVGSAGECQTSDRGFLVGKGHYTYIIVEQHWNNPLLVADYYDSSGMTFYLTPNLRQYNMGYLLTGQEEFVIPPKESAYTITGTCPESCLKRKLTDSIYITAAHVHMHYLGTKGKIEHYRDGEVINTWFDLASYSYDLPVFIEFDPPIELKPSDKIVTTCTFQSLDQSEDTKFGEATSDEMCYGFMNYYPVETGTGSCISYGSYDECEILDYYEYLDNAANGLSQSALLAMMSLFLILCR